MKGAIMTPKALKTKLGKLSRNKREVFIAALNAGLAKQDGKIPRRLRIDPITLELYRMEPVTGLYDVGAISKIIQPVLTALKGVA